jgi:hypothetical protein
MDLNTNPKVKIAEGEGVGAHSLTHSTSGVEGNVGAPGQFSTFSGQESNCQFESRSFFWS